MKELFIKKMSEVGRVIWQIKLFNLAVDTIICFLISAIVLKLVGVNAVYGLVLAALYLVLTLLRETIKSNVIRTVEERNKGLDERLRTAFDNRNRENVVVEHLLADVSDKIDNIETSVFMDSKKISYKVVASMALVFVMLLITVIDFRGQASSMFDLNDLMRSIEFSLKERGIEYDRVIGGGDRWETSNLTTDQEKNKLGAEAGGERPGFHMGPTPGTGGGVGSDEIANIYGQASSASIEGKNIDVNLRPDYGGEIEIKDEKPNVEQATVVNPEGTESAEKCDECAIGPGHEDLVKRYFEKLLGEA